MDRREFSNLGEDIKNIVQDAVNTRDFHQLNRDISNTVNSAIDEVRRSIGQHQRYGGQWDRNRVNEPWNRDFDQRQNSQWNRQPNSKPWQNTVNHGRNQTPKTYTPVKKPTAFTVPVGRISGILLSVFGNIGVGLLGIAVVVLSIIGHLTNTEEVFGTIVIGLIPFLIISFFMAVRGGRIRKRLKRFQQYMSLLNGRNYCLIKDLSLGTSLTNKFITKDLQKMITAGMFPEGHIDEQKTCFMLNRESYDQYLKLLENMKAQKAAEQERKQGTSSKNDIIGQEARKSIDEGRQFIRNIREANDAIPGEEVSRKLDRLEAVTGKIFDYVEIHPDQLPEIKKFMEYYLPTTLKLLNAYKEFDYQPVQGENITTAKREIEQTLDTINLAFENLLDSLFEDVAMDISTDISVLETMLAQEGLTEKNFK